MERKYDLTEENGKEPMECIPGQQSCIYMKDGIDIFSQNCECSLNAKNLPQGYCPIPSLYHLTKNNHWLKLLWLGDTCHTYDRKNIQAQLECGIGMNNDVLVNVTRTNFNVKYYPYVQSVSNIECIESFVHDSNFNMFEELSYYIKVGVSTLVFIAINYI